MLINKSLISKLISKLAYFVASSLTFYYNRKLVFSKNDFLISFNYSCDAQTVTPQVGLLHFAETVQN